MTTYSIPTPGSATRAQIDELRRLTIIPRNIVAFVDGKDFIGQAGYGPPLAGSQKLWRDNAALGGAYPGAWYVAVQGTCNLASPTGMGDGFSDKVTFGVLSPTVAKFYHTNQKYFPAIPRIYLEYITAPEAGRLSFNTLNVDDVYPMGTLMADPVGPIDFLHDGQIQFGVQPTAEKYRWGGPSDFGLMFDANGQACWFNIYEWKAPAVVVPSSDYPWSSLADGPLVDTVAATLEFGGSVADKAARLKKGFGR